MITTLCCVLVATSIELVQTTVPDPGLFPVPHGVELVRVTLRSR